MGQEVGGEEWEWGWRRAGAGNKGFARRPPEFLGWEEYDREEAAAEVPGLGGGSGGARPQEFLGWEVGGRM